jgi:hypothetical protein
MWTDVYRQHLDVELSSNTEWDITVQLYAGAIAQLTWARERRSCCDENSHFE